MNDPERPLAYATRLLKHPVTVVLALVVLLFHGLYTDVMPADFYYTLPVGVFCAAAGLALSVPVWRRMRRNDPHFGNAVTRPLAYLSMPGLLALMAWMFVAKSLPWTAAVLVGTPHTESHAFTLEMYRRKGCDARAKPVERLNLFPGSLCVGEDYVRRHGHRVVQIRLIGDRTPLGFRITRIEHQDLLGPAPADPRTR